jgi:hypothetical protein
MIEVMDGRMRRVALAIVVAALAPLVAVGTSVAAIPHVSNPALRSVVSEAFRDFTADYNAFVKCHVCPDGLSPVIADVTHWEKLLNELPSHSGATYDAYRNAYEALREFGLASVYSATGATETGTQQTDERALALADFATAQGDAKRAAIALGLGTYP